MENFNSEIKKAADKLKLPFTVKLTLLKKSTLATIETQEEGDCSIIIHKNEGRLLLTDENGLYDNFLKKELIKKGNFCSPLDGNVLLVIYDESSEEVEKKDLETPPDESEKSFYEKLYNHDVISTISASGKQPFADLLSKHFRLIFMSGEDTENQKLYLLNFLHRILSRHQLQKEYCKFGLVSKSYPKDDDSQRKETYRNCFEYLLTKPEIQKTQIEILLREIGLTSKDLEKNNCNLI